MGNIQLGQFRMRIQDKFEPSPQRNSGGDDESQAQKEKVPDYSAHLYAKIKD